MSYFSNLDYEEQEQREVDSMAAYVADWQIHDDIAKRSGYGMRRLINREGMESAVKNARNDHPRVRRIQANTFGVTCGKVGCKSKSEHIVTFIHDMNEIWATCKGCPVEDHDRTGLKICRHIAAAYQLFEILNRRSAA